MVFTPRPRSLRSPTNQSRMNQPQNQPPRPKESEPQAASSSRPARSRLALQPRQAAFVKNYTDRKSPTFGNALQSAVKAGYSRDFANRITAVLSENVRTAMTMALEAA